MKEISIGSILKCFCIAGLLFFALCAVVLFVGTLRTHWIAETNQHEKDVYLVSHGCSDTKAVRLSGIEELCNSKTDSVVKTPSESALYRTFEDWNLCGKDGCAAVFGKLRRPLELVILMVLLIVGAIAVALVMSLGKSSSSLTIPAFVSARQDRQNLESGDNFAREPSWKPKFFDGSQLSTALNGVFSKGAGRDSKKVV